MRKAEVSSMERENLARSQVEVEIRALRNDPDQALDNDLVEPHVMVADKRLAGSRANARGEDPDGGRFPRAVRSKEAKDFTSLNLERDAVKSSNLRLRLLTLRFRSSKGEAAYARGHGRRRGVHLAQIDRANAG